ncbi:tetratricopeptide repeat protein [Planctomicrobium sp. SH661]|uniref:tetratricopeptide repeat protein n=1 Tax=Planctomicrobium sp. SH661 TaxID=3448124 RepID=UPI003F5CA3A5
MTLRLHQVVCVLGWTMALSLLGEPVIAQDRVTFTPSGTSGPVTAVGTVLDYTGRALTIQTASGVQHLPTASITSIETTYDPVYQRGIQEFQQGQTPAAQASFREAFEREQRLWVKREIRSWLVKCSLRQQDLIGAIREFREITLTDPQSRFWGIAPLVWSPVAISEGVRSEMQPWLKSERESERMLAASLLLLDPVLGEAAEDQLNQLARDTNPVLSSYSRAQLWRLPLASRNVSDVMLQNWRGDIERLPPELRSGPQSLLARGYEIQGDLRKSVSEALWLPYVYSENEPLAARALYDSAEALAKSGLTQEAKVLQQELVARYPWSREASFTRSETRQPVQN